MKARSQQVARTKEQENKSPTIPKVLALSRGGHACPLGGVWGLSFWNWPFGKRGRGRLDRGPGDNPQNVLSLSFQVLNVSFYDSQRLTGRLVN